MKVLGVLLLFLSGAILYLYFVKGQKPSDMWNTLTNFFQPSSAGKASAAPTGGSGGTFKYSPN